MTTALETRKSAELKKRDAVVRDINSRMVRAWQSRCAKVERADAEYLDAIQRVNAAVSSTPVVDQVDEPAPVMEATT